MKQFILGNHVTRLSRRKPASPALPPLSFLRGA
jgi:hypothetical protein